MQVGCDLYTEIGVVFPRVFCYLVLYKEEAMNHAVEQFVSRDNFIFSH